MRGRARLLFLAAIAALAAGCRSPQTRALEFGSGAAGSTRVVVAPLNLPVQLSPDLEDAVDPVSAEMIRYLQGRGTRVAVIWAPDAWSLWRDSTAALQASGRPAPDIAEVAATFSHSLADHADYDLIVFPSLVYRDARVTGRFAQWDGVKRRIRFRARTGVAVGRAQAVPDPLFSKEQSADAGEVPGWRGRITGLSLHTLVFTPEGRAVYQGFGGLDLVHDAVQQSEGSPEPPVLQLHPNLLENADHVREGVALALDPYLVKQRAR